jgi:2-oxoglutarate ferredoxin oxidoreductase subunit beta
MTFENRLVNKYARAEHLPHIWCYGCGHGIVMHAFMEAAEKVGLDRDKTVLISGIGCAGRITGYLDFNTMHVTHGRALAFGTGVKLGNPELNVVVFMGDGDATAIGGGHFIHAARRNVDLTVIVLNNHVYGMTGGQSSPTTLPGMIATTAPYGSIERYFDISELAVASGANFVVRGTVYHYMPLVKYMSQALMKKGFSLVEAMCYCHVTHGRRNNLITPWQNMQWIKEKTVSREQAKREGAQGRIVTGVLVDRDWPEYTEAYREVMERSRRKR